MAKTLQNTIDWTSPLIRYMPLTLGASNEPALTNANMVLQTIMGPPFAWRWNRKTLHFDTIAGTQDYSVNVSDFGFAEKANVAYSTTENKEAEIKNVLGMGKEIGRPSNISAQLEIDDSIGHSVVFRLLPVPDKVYTVTITYQAKPTLFTGVNTAWPIPDEYGYIYNYGFLTLALMHTDDPRLPFFNQKFVSALLSTNRGLSEVEKNIFLGNWMALLRQETTEQIKTQQGNMTRAV